MNRKITKDEEKAIAALRRLETQWPSSLWLYSANGQLHVMACDTIGQRMVDPQTGGMDPSGSVAVIDIPNDGGDW